MILTFNRNMINKFEIILTNSIEYFDFDSFVFDNEIDTNYDINEFKKNLFDEINFRLTMIYNLDILKPENGYSKIKLTLDNEEQIAKFNLLKFLLNKMETGGENWVNDGSAELFERISANSIKNYLGQGTETILIGEGKENLTIKKLKEICRIMNEPFGSTNNLPKKAKDDGVDFIAYKKFDERNIGNIIILGQACVGKNYYKKKAIFERWQTEYITYFIKPPLRLLSTVHFLEWDGLKKVQSDFNGAIVFDRGRIMRYFNPEDINLNNDIINYNSTYNI